MYMIICYCIKKLSLWRGGCGVEIELNKLFELNKFNYLEDKMYRFKRELRKEKNCEKKYFN